MRPREPRILNLDPPPSLAGAPQEKFLEYLQQLNALPGAGVYVGMTGNSLRLGPAQATATEAAEGIAVVPFEVRGADLEIWRERPLRVWSRVAL